MGWVKLSIDKPPPWVISTVKDVSTSSNELKRRIGTYQCVMLADNDECIDIVACPHVKDIAFYGAYFRVFNNGVESEDRVFFRGKVLDPKELPYDGDPGLKMFVIYDDWIFVEFDSMRETVVFISGFMKRVLAENVEDFVIIMGKKYEGGALNAANRNIERLTSELWRKADVG